MSIEKVTESLSQLSLTTLNCCHQPLGIKYWGEFNSKAEAEEFAKKIPQDQNYQTVIRPVRVTREEDEMQMTEEEKCKEISELMSKLKGKFDQEKK